MAYVNALGVDLVSTGVDTAFRPGESVYDYMKRIAQQVGDYSKFIDSQKASGAVVSQPLLPSAPPSPPPKSSSRNTLLLVGAGLALAFVMLKKPK